MLASQDLFAFKPQLWWKVLYCQTKNMRSQRSQTLEGLLRTIDLLNLCK